jgi:cold shock CspA family protein
MSVSSQPGSQTQEVPPPGALSGTVKFFNYKNGYGFIAIDGADEDVRIIISLNYKSGYGFIAIVCGADEDVRLDRDCKWGG